MKMSEIDEMVNNYPTKHKEGFTSEEMNLLVEALSLDRSTFYDKLGVNIGMIVGGDYLTYHCDVALALICTIEDRDKRVEEWD